VNTKAFISLSIVLLAVTITVTALLAPMFAPIFIKISNQQLNPYSNTALEAAPSSTEDGKALSPSLSFSEQAIAASKTALEHPMMLNSEPPNGILIQNNQLVLSHKLKGVFDYFLLLQNIEEIETIEYLLHQHAEVVLDGSYFNNSSNKDRLLRELNRTFNKYQEFLSTPPSIHNIAIENNNIDSNSIETLNSIHEEIKQHRRTHLGPKLAEAFYHQSENYDQQQIANAKAFVENNTVPESFNSMAFKNINLDLVFYDNNNFTAEMRYEDRKEKYGIEVAERWRSYE